MKELANKVCKLIDVKSIVTLVLTFGFIFLTIRGTITAEQFIAIYTVIIGFYFGTQFQKGISDTKNKE